MELKGKLGQSSVNELLNNFSSVNPLTLPDIMKVDPSEEKCSSETINQDGNLSWLCTISIQCLNMDYPLA